MPYWELTSACLSMQATGRRCSPSHELPRLKGQTPGCGGPTPGWGVPAGSLRDAGRMTDPVLVPFQVILSESNPADEVPFFETWMLTCMPEEGKILNPDHPCFRPDSTKVESLVALLNNSSEMKLV